MQPLKHSAEEIVISIMTADKFEHLLNTRHHCGALQILTNFIVTTALAGSEEKRGSKETGLRALHAIARDELGAF